MRGGEKKPHFWHIRTPGLMPHIGVIYFSTGVTVWGTLQFLDLHCGPPPLSFPSGEHFKEKNECDF